MYMKTTYMTSGVFCAKSLMMKLMLVVGMMVLCGGNFVWGDNASITFSDQGYTNQQEITTVSIDDIISVTFNKGTNSNAPKYFTSGTAIRAYGGNYFTVSSTGGNITEISLTFGSSDGSNTITTDVSTYNNGMWTGSSSSVKFTIGGTSGNRRIAGITVTYNNGSTAYTVTFNAGSGFCSQPPITNSIITLPSAIPPAGCDPEYTFYGWATAPVSETTNAPSIVGTTGNTYRPTGSITLYAVYKQAIGGNVEKTYGWESADDATFWEFSNMNNTNTDISPHGGSKYGTTAGTATAYIKTASKIANPISIECYYSKTTNNNHASAKFVISVSSDGSSWTNVAMGNTFNSVTKGDWYSLSADLSSYENHYVEVYYLGSGSTAVRALDDVRLVYNDVVNTYNTSPSCTPPTSVSITYNANGGSTTCSNVAEHPYNTNYTICATPPTKPCYTFLGWNDGSNTCSAGSTIENLTHNTTLTAQWEIISYTVTKGPESHGTFTLSPASLVNCGGTVTVTAVPESNYGVSSVTATNGTVTGSGNSWSVENITANTTISVTFYPLPRYEVSFSTGTAHSVASRTEASFESGVVLPSTESCGEYTFIGWRENEVVTETENITGTCYGVGDTYYPAANCTLYAVYRRNIDFDYDKIGLVNIVSGGNYIINAENSSGGWAVDNIMTSNQLNSAETHNEGSLVNIVDESLVWRIYGNSTDGYYLYNVDADKYLNIENSVLVYADSPKKYTITSGTNPNEVVFTSVEANTNNVFSFFLSQRVFNAYTRSSTPLYLYYNATYYTTAPSCDCTVANVTVNNSTCAVGEYFDLGSCFSSQNTSDVTFSCSQYGSSIVGSMFVASAAGTYTIAALQERDGTYCSVHRSFTITVKYKVQWSVDNNIVETDYYNSGENLENPSYDVESFDCDGRVFVGWATEPIYETDDRPSMFTTAGGSVRADATYYAVFAREGGDPVETLSQTLQYDTWAYYGSTTDKNSYRLFHAGSYIESESFDLSKLSKVIVYGGTFGGSGYNSLTIGSGSSVWKNVTVSGSNQTGRNEYTSGTALSGINKLRVTSNSGTASGTGVRISKVEIFLTEAYFGYTTFCTEPTCLRPTSLSIVSVGQTTATVSWIAQSGESQWEYYCSEFDVTPTVAMGITSDNPYEITGLSANTRYYWWIRAKCDESDYSDWMLGGSFVTACSSTTILESGDLAMLAINNKVSAVSGNSADEFSFVIFKDIDAGTAIDITDNGYECDYAGYWGTSEGFWRIIRNNFPLEKGSVITFAETQGRIGYSINPSIGSNINIYVNGVLDNNNWGIVVNGPLDLNPEDQIWIMQGGSWVVYGENKAEYTGNVLYGYTATGWKDSPGYENKTHGSTIYPGRDCFISTLNIASGIAKYKGSLEEATKQEWIMRINSDDNWYGFTTENYHNVYPEYKDEPNGPYGDNEPGYPLTVLDGDFTHGKWSGMKSDNWCNCANWMSLVVPDETFDVEIPDIGGNYRIAVHSGDTAKCKTLTIKDEGYFTATGNASTLLVAEDIIVEDGGTFQPAENNDFEIILGGNIERVGTFETNSSTSLTLVGESAQNIPAPTSGGNLKLRNLTVSSASNIFASDTIELYGNLTDNSSSHNGFDLPQSVTFKGNEVQTSTATSLTNVTMNKSANDLSLSDTLVVNSKCKLVKGNIIGNVTFASSAQSEGASTNSYIDGTVTKIASASEFSFPTGSNGVLGQMDVSSLSSITSLNFHFKEGGFSASEMPVWWNQNNMCNDNGSNEKFDHVSNMYFWNLGTSSTIEGASFSVSASDDVHFNDTIINQRDASVIKMAIYDGCWKNIGGTASAPSPYNQVSMSNINLGATRAAVGEKTLSFGSVDENTILPIELTSFTATCNGKFANLAWTTASERNNDYFIVERSHDAVNFNEIARVAGAGNSIEQLDYNYVDYSAASGDNYYRLVQVDYDGTRTASEIVVASCREADGDPEVHVFPNPFHNDVTIHMENIGGATVSIEIYDMLGRMITTKEIAVDGNSEETMLQLGDLPNVTYNVRISTADFVVNRKVVKE